MSKLHDKIEYNSCSDGWNSVKCYFRIETGNTGMVDLYRKEGDLQEENLGIFNDDDIRALIKILSQ